MLSILRYVLLSAVRNRLYIGLFITLISSFSFSIFLGSTSLVEQQQMISAYVAGSSRAILAIGMVLFVCLNIARAFENKEVEFVISKSISRQQFILGYLGGFFIAALLIFLPLILAMFFILNPDFVGLFAWSATILLEIFILISFSLLASLILKNSFLAIISSFGFYIISRLMGVFVLAINLPENVSEIKGNVFAFGLKILSSLFPRLDFFAQSSWLSYGINDFTNFRIILMQSLIYIPLMIFMAFHDFKKKQF